VLVPPAGPAGHAESRSSWVEPHRLMFSTTALQRAGSSGPTGWQATAPLPFPTDAATRDSDSPIVAVLPMSAGGSRLGTEPTRRFDMSNEGAHRDVRDCADRWDSQGCLPLCQSLGATSTVATAVAAATCTTGVGASAWCCRVVSLDPLHEQIARVAFALPAAGISCRL
jgi:hypothetical protein